MSGACGRHGVDTVTKELWCDPSGTERRMRGDVDVDVLPGDTWVRLGAAQVPRSEQLTQGAKEIFTKKLTMKLGLQDEEAFAGTEGSWGKEHSRQREKKARRRERRTLWGTGERGGQARAALNEMGEGGVGPATLSALPRDCLASLTGKRETSKPRAPVPTSNSPPHPHRTAHRSETDASAVSCGKWVSESQPCRCVGMIKWNDISTVPAGVPQTCPLPLFAFVCVLVMDHKCNRPVVRQAT